MEPFKCQSWTYHELLALCFHGFLFAWGQANIQVWGYLIREFLACIFSAIHAWFLNILDMLHCRGCSAGCSLTQNEHALLERMGSQPDTLHLCDFHGKNHTLYGWHLLTVEWFSVTELMNGLELLMSWLHQFHAPQQSSSICFFHLAIGNCS